MTDSYAKLTIYRNSKQLFAKPKDYTQQSIEIPSHSGGYRVIKRNVTAIGTMDIDHYSHQRAELGRVAYNGCIVEVLKIGTTWQAIDYREVKGCNA